MIDQSQNTPKCNSNTQNSHEYSSKTLKIPESYDYQNSISIKVANQKEKYVKNVPKHGQNYIGKVKKEEI